MRWSQSIVLTVLLIAVPTVSSPVFTNGTEMSPRVTAALQKLETRFGLKSEDCALIVDPDSQSLFLIRNNRIEAIYPVSTSLKGLGNRDGSYQTPTGTHRICAKYGEGSPVGTIFRARKSTGKIAKIYTDKTDSPDDYVTTRILRLKGMEPGVNKGKGIDSYRRFIYIHGTPEEGLIGTPASHGCIRMKNTDVIALFDTVPVGTLVEILTAAKND